VSDFTITDRNNLTALIGRMEKAETAIRELQNDRRVVVVEPVVDPLIRTCEERDALKQHLELARGLLQVAINSHPLNQSLHHRITLFLKETL
jgi:hypothetical protein